MTTKKDYPCFGVSVRTPAGFTSAFAIVPEERVASLIRRSVDYFRSRDELEGDKFGLSLVRDAEPDPLDSDKRFGHYDLTEGDVLHLVSHQPYIDGR